MGVDGVRETGKIVKINEERTTSPKSLKDAGSKVACTTSTLSATLALHCSARIRGHWVAWGVHE